jgi:AcrR family transcriptional regulator
MPTLTLIVTQLLEHDSASPRARLIQAAMELFVEEGYRASIERIAVQAGVARQTFYNHFSCKADLFEEVIHQGTAVLLVALDGSEQNLGECLLRFGGLYRQKVLSNEGLGFFRTMAAESVHFPELAQNFYRTGPVQTTARLTLVMQAAIDRGELRNCAAEFAAKLFLSMLVGADRTRYLFSGEPPPEPDSAEVERIVDCFLRALAPEAGQSV